MNNMEIGPIRPPSEAESMMLRVTRGCHYNKCYFCDLYKQYKFSKRSIKEIESDLIEAAASPISKRYTTCFLQDGDAFVLKTEYLLQILTAIHKHLPNIKYITMYSRADSIARKSPNELKMLKEAGITHLYCGMETGSDTILKMINKGFNSEIVVESGCKAKEAGFILSEFTLFGIGGREFADENAVETARVLNIIKPDYIRVHATGLKPSSQMWKYVTNKVLTLQTEEEIIKEQKMHLQRLNAMNSYYMNEHIVNLLLEVRGNLQSEKGEMIQVVDEYLGLPQAEKELFNVGRRLNIMFTLDELKNNSKREQALAGLNKLKNSNPKLDLAYVCNYIRQTQI